MADALGALDASIGQTLVYRHGEPGDVVPAFAAEVGARTVLAAEDFGPYGRNRDATVAARLERDDRILRTLGSPYAVAPGSVRKDDGKSYSVFSPFHRRWIDQLDITSLDSTDVRWRGAPAVRSDGPPVRPDPTCDIPVASELEAGRLLDGFIEGGGIDRYAETARSSGRQRYKPPIAVSAMGHRASATSSAASCAVHIIRCVPQRTCVAGLLCGRARPPTRLCVAESPAGYERDAASTPARLLANDSRPGRTAQPDIRSSTPECASCSQPVGCTTACG